MNSALGTSIYVVSEISLKTKVVSIDNATSGPESLRYIRLDYHESSFSSILVSLFELRCFLLENIYLTVRNLLLNRIEKLLD